ncbi:MAG: four helix bundle protein [Alphaproteobacteria bacterium]|nr:four helix bundle protein [Alphaproteobacteria bacterium]
MSPIKNYRDLKVWQKAMDMVALVYELTAQFPADQKYVLVSQMQRSALSVPSNIAEGRSRHSEKDFVYHLNIARGSLAELETQVILSCRLGYMNKQDENTLLQMTEEITKMLHGLKSSLKSSGESEVIELALLKPKT